MLKQTIGFLDVSVGVNGGLALCLQLKKSCGKRKTLQSEVASQASLIKTNGPTIRKFGLL